MSNNENMLKKVEELISEYYGPNYNNQTVDFINGVGQYYANNPENFMELFKPKIGDAISPNNSQKTNKKNNEEKQIAENIFSWSWSPEKSASIGIGISLNIL